jgi:hypothetical protein
MTTVHEIEDAVSQLSSDELTQFRAWFETFEAEVWDSQFERDVKAGRLDSLASQAIADFKAGKCTAL